MPRGEFRPCRLIHGFGSSTSLGIFEMPCDSVEDALEAGRALSSNSQDFADNFTVVRWLDEPVDGRDYEAVPEDIVSYLKGAMS